MSRAEPCGPTARGGKQRKFKAGKLKKYAATVRKMMKSKVYYFRFADGLFLLRGRSKSKPKRMHKCKFGLSYNMINFTCGKSLARACGV